jgi:two-component system cell cycle response regulator DivK
VSAGRPIIVVEDDALQRKLYCDVLRSQHYEAIDIGDPRLVPDVIGRTSPLAAVIDIRLPHIDGRDLIEALRRDSGTRLLPIFALSAVVSPDMAETCLAAGANCFYAKPVPLKTFLEVMAQLTAGTL